MSPCWPASKWWWQAPPCCRGRLPLGFSGSLCSYTKTRLGKAHRGVGHCRPALWLMGNLGRAGYLATTKGFWPFSYNRYALPLLSVACASRPRNYATVNARRQLGIRQAMLPGSARQSSTGCASAAAKVLTAAVSPSVAPPARSQTNPFYRLCSCGGGDVGPSAGGADPPVGQNITAWWVLAVAGRRMQQQGAWRWLALQPDAGSCTALIWTDTSGPVRARLPGVHGV